MKIGIRRAQQSDDHAVEQIAYQVFGPGYFIVDYLTTYHQMFVAIDEHADRVVGFVTILHPSDQTSSSICIETIATCPDYQRCGIANLLFEHCEQKIAQHTPATITTITTPAWMVGQTINLLPLLLKRNYHTLRFTKRPWKQQCEQQHFCIYYDGQCHCDVVYFYKQIRS